MEQKDCLVNKLIEKNDPFNINEGNNNITMIEKSKCLSEKNIINNST